MILQVPLVSICLSTLVTLVPRSVHISQMLLECPIVMKHFGAMVTLDLFSSQKIVHDISVLIGWLGLQLARPQALPIEPQPFFSCQIAWWQKRERAANTFPFWFLPHTVPIFQAISKLCPPLESSHQELSNEPKFFEKRPKIGVQNGQKPKVAWTSSPPPLYYSYHHFSCISGFGFLDFLDPIFGLFWQNLGSYESPWAELSNGGHNFTVAWKMGTVWAKNQFDDERQCPPFFAANDGRVEKKGLRFNWQGLRPCQLQPTCHTCTQECSHLSNASSVPNCCETFWCNGHIGFVFCPENCAWYLCVEPKPCNLSKVCRSLDIETFVLLSLGELFPCEFDTFLGQSQRIGHILRKFASHMQYWMVSVNCKVCILLWSFSNNQ